MDQKDDHPFKDAHEWDNWNPAAVRDVMGTHGLGKFLQFQYESHGTDWVELSLDWREALVGVAETGVIASGVVISLMDIAASQSVWTRLNKFHPHATMDLRVDYLRPSPPGKRLFGRAECYRITRSVAFVRGIAHNGHAEDPVAHIAATFINTSGYLK